MPEHSDTGVRSDELLSDIESLKPLDYARRWWIPRRNENKPVSGATMNRWGRKGVKGVRLPMLFTPDGAVTSEPACKWFLKQVDAARRAEHLERDSAMRPATAEQMASFEAMAR